MNNVNAALTLAALLVCTACAMSSYEGARPARSGTQIAGSQLVVYSFLEAKSDFFGETMVQQLHKQLLARLAEHGVTARLVVYSRNDTVPPSAPDRLTAPSEPGAVPLKDYLRSQRPDETRHADKYRLVVMPGSMSSMRSNLDSRIDWTLTEIATEQPVWFVHQKTTRTVIFSADEAPETRASHFVDGAIAQMAEGGLFGSEPAKK